jgi:2-methylisocitrate lyase-like PEP mutase family enzyme
MTIDIATQRQKAEAFRKLHDRSRILVLPNAWDVASAKIFEAAGFRAVATTSSGVANSLGYPDGEAVSREEMLDVIRRIARALDVPLSADIEAGYASDVDSLKATIRAVIEAGAVGINLEDSMKGGSNELFAVETAVARIKAVRETATAAGVPIVINARTDVFLHAIGDKNARFEHTVSRANSYLAAGADCIFVPGPANAEIIGKLTGAIRGPINVMVLPGMPSAPELEKLGVARVSTGGGPARAALTALRGLAKELFESGTYSAFTASDLISHMEMNQLVAKKP